MNPTVQNLVSQFTQQVAIAIQGEVRATISQALARAGLGEKRGPGRPRKDVVLPISFGANAQRAPRQLQLCPVPGCKNAAAPVYGMVCANHRGISKTRIAEYRAARREMKLAGYKKIYGAAKAKKPAKPTKSVKNGVSAKKVRAKAKKK